MLEMFADYMKDNMKDDVVPEHKEWGLIEIVGVDSKGKETKKNINSLLKFAKVEYDTSHNSELRFYSKTTLKKPTFKVGTNSLKVDSEIFNFVVSILHQRYQYMKYMENCILFSTVDMGNFIDDTPGARKRLMLSYLAKGAYARGFLPCPQGFEGLKLKDAIDEGLYKTYGIGHCIILSPCIRTKSATQDNSQKHYAVLEYCVDESVIDYVYNNRADVNTTRGQIKATFSKFKEEFQPIVEEINSTKDKKR